MVLFNYSPFSFDGSCHRMLVYKAILFSRIRSYSDSAIGSLFVKYKNPLKSNAH